MTDARRRLILIIGGVLAVAVIVTGVVVLWPSSKSTAGSSEVPTINSGPPVGTTVDNFLKLVGAGDGGQAGPMTDNPPTAQNDVGAFGKNIASAKVVFSRKTSVDESGGRTALQVPVKVVWTISQTDTWQYDSALNLTLTAGKWLVKWAPSILYPQLQPGQNLALLGGVTGPEGQAAVVGEDGSALANWTGATAKPVDPKTSPLILSSIVRGASKPGETDTRHVSVVDGAGKEIGSPVHGTVNKQATPVGPIKTTLNPRMSIAAQNAVSTQSNATMLVAIKPSTGGILAVAQNDAAGSALTALNGLYQPGSTFKVTTVAAGIQQQSLNQDSQVQCPGQGTFSSRTIHNANNFDLGTVSLRTAFAHSCNTTFAQMASQLPPDALNKSASQFGLNADFTIPGITTELGKVENSDSPTRQVENAIGQGTVLASPLGMAMVAATVGAKKAVTPQLLKDSPTQVTAGYKAPPAAVLSQIQSMMREVVASGTASKKLKGFSDLAGKTGTAETTNDGAEAHGWFIGIRGDVAFAVLVKDGGSSSAALDVAGAFLKGF
ncbi:penicillin-binding transpeptidase domain-containing protein [Actinocrispum wychmicini]|nr:penicillin-binding transpeptidase domain-containing protein [Actinocrispum wychmicini]